MSKTWTFIGGVVAGIVGVFTAAAVAVELERVKSGSRDVVDEPQRRALPEADGV